MRATIATLSPDNGTAFFGTVTNRLHLQAVDVASGRQRWNVSAVEPGIPAVTGDGGSIVVASVGNNDWPFVYLNGWNAFTGELLWQANLTTGSMSAPVCFQASSTPIAVGGGGGASYVCVVLDGALMRAFDATRGGREMWRTSLPSQLTTDLQFDSVNRRVVLGIGHDVRSYDAATGNLTWTRVLAKATSSQYVIGPGGFGYIGLAASGLAKLDTATGALHWIFFGHAAGKSKSASHSGTLPALGDEAVYFGTSGQLGTHGTVYAVSAATGQQQWALAQAEWSIAGPISVVLSGTGATKLIVTTQDALVLLVDAASGALEKSCSHVLGGLMAYGQGLRTVHLPSGALLGLATGVFQITAVSLSGWL